VVLGSLWRQLSGNKLLMCLVWWSQEELDPGAAVAMGVPMSGAALILLGRASSRLGAPSLWVAHGADRRCNPLTCSPSLMLLRSHPAGAAVGGECHEPGGGCRGGGDGGGGAAAALAPRWRAGAARAQRRGLEVGLDQCGSSLVLEWLPHSPQGRHLGTRASPFWLARLSGTVWHSGSSTDNAARDCFATSSSRADTSLRAISTDAADPTQRAEYRGRRFVAPCSLELLSYPLPAYLAGPAPQQAAGSGGTAEQQAQRAQRAQQRRQLYGVRLRVAGSGWTPPLALDLGEPQAGGNGGPAGQGDQTQVWSCLVWAAGLVHACIAVPFS
jgi:hypothetical protein